MLVAVVLSFVGCKKKAAESEAEAYAVNHKIEVDSEGTIIETLVEKFEKDYYSKEELTAFVGEEIGEYSKKAGVNKIAISGLEESDDKISLEMRYEAYEDYAAFNDVVLFVGTISEAISAGYDFDAGFDQISKGKVKAEGVKADVIMALGADCSVVITNQAVKVMTPSNITYISQNAAIAGKKAARVDDENATEQRGTAEDTTAASEETDGSDVIQSQQNQVETNEKLAYIIYK